MSQWYLSKGGKAVGPLSEDKIIELIGKGELSHLDLIYQTGGSEWLSLSQVGVFKEHLGSQEPQHEKGQGEAEWILLKKIKKEDESKYEQLGPFSEPEVLKWLERGEIKFNDFAWKKGLESWVRISEVEAFAKPLPSSPEIDRDLYEPTQALETETIIENSKKESLSQMVHIERFDPEKTQVSRQGSIPINDEGFVPESELTGVGEDVNLWSLEPPGRKNAKSEKKKQKKEEEEADQVEDLKPHAPGTKKASEHRKKSSSTKKKSRSKGSHSITKEKIQLVGALCAFVLAFVFLYFSFTADKEPIPRASDAPSYLEDSKEVKSSADTSSLPSTNSGQELQKKVQKFKEMAARAEVERKQIRERESKKEKVRKQHKKIPIAQAKKKRRLVRPSQKVKSAKEKSKKRKSVVVAKAKKLPVPGKKNLVSRKKSRVTQKRVATTSRSPKLSTPAGSAKAQSFYKQRDRLALFYSSLKAEKLAVEIQSQFKKLQKNKAAWARYYGQWRKKVRSSLARDIRAFPNRNKTYAYPQLMAAFKKDYELFYKYGETFDLKVKGVRAPSSSSKDMRSVFAKYRKRALSLGR